MRAIRISERTNLKVFKWDLLVTLRTHNGQHQELTHVREEYLHCRMRIARLALQAHGEEEVFDHS